MPYLLPTDPDVSELACVLVFYPNAAEYRQALFGQLAELSDVWNWEGTREQQALARAVWLAAELETINNMSCLDELLAEVQAINAKLPWCCDDGTGWSDGVEGGGGTIIIWPTPGPPPLPIPDTDFGTDDYPITPVTDPDEGGTVSEADWEQYLCGAANYVIDSLIDYFRFVRFQRSFTSSFLGVIRWLQARIAGAVVPGLIDDFALWELNDLLDTVIGAFEDVPIAVLDAAIADLENLREDVFCAILGVNTAENAIDAILAVLFGSIDNALAQSLIGNPVALFASLIWNGALDVAWRDDCECTEPTGLFWAVQFADTQYNLGAGWVNYPTGQYTLPVVYGQEILWRQSTGTGINTVNLRLVNDAGVNTGEHTWESEYVGQAAGNAVTHYILDASGATVHAQHNLFVGTVETGIVGNRSNYSGNAIRDEKNIRVVVTA